MGDRLCNPATGTFTSPDPDPGGSSWAYGYPNDPVNAFDLNGRSWWRKALKYTAIGAGVIGALACGASIICGVAAGRLLDLEPMRQCAPDVIKDGLGEARA